jgi:hypothetical protein
VTGRGQHRASVDETRHHRRSTCRDAVRIWLRERSRAVSTGGRRTPCRPNAVGGRGRPGQHRTATARTRRFRSADCRDRSARTRGRLSASIGATAEPNVPKCPMSWLADDPRICRASAASGARAQRGIADGIGSVTTLRRTSRCVRHGMDATRRSTHHA